MKINASTTDEEILTMNDCERDECHCVIVASNLLELCNQREAARRTNLLKEFTSSEVAIQKQWKGKLEKLKDFLKDQEQIPVVTEHGLGWNKAVKRIIIAFDEIFGEKK